MRDSGDVYLAIMVAGIIMMVLGLALASARSSPPELLTLRLSAAPARHDFRSVNPPVRRISGTERLNPG